MKIIVNKKDQFTRQAVCAIGSFDGIHRGHQEIIKRLKKLAGPGKRTGIITLYPLPIAVLGGVRNYCLTPKREKEEILQGLDLDFIYYFRFTKKFSQLKPKEFVQLVAVRVMPSLVVVGENFHFGKDRKGTAKILKELSQGLFEVEIVPRLKHEGTISSTRIRELLLLGNISAANQLLGREYTITGKVIKGKGKGTKLGFPTINLEVGKEKLLPLDGVYKVRVIFDSCEFLGAMFCHHDLIEVYIINFSGSLYKRWVTVQIVKRLRDIENFASDEALKSAIAKDVCQICLPETR